MSTTTKKHSQFISEPMGDKLVTELAGIGQVHGKALTQKNFDKAYHVLGKFLLLSKEETQFKDWLRENCKANAKEQAECYNCLQDYCKHFV